MLMQGITLHMRWWNPRGWRYSSLANIITHHLAPGHPPASLLLSSPPSLFPSSSSSSSSSSSLRGLHRFWASLPCRSLTFHLRRLTVQDTVDPPAERTEHSLSGHTNPSPVCTATSVSLARPFFPLSSHLHIITLFYALHALILARQPANPLENTTPPQCNKRIMQVIPPLTIIHL